MYRSEFYKIGNWRTRLEEPDDSSVNVLTFGICPLKASPKLTAVTFVPFETDVVS